MTNSPRPMPLPPLPKLNIPEQEEVIDTPKIDLTPVDQPVVSDKPTEEQINSFKSFDVGSDRHLWINRILLDARQ
jgi:hypothetical protein